MSFGGGGGQVRYALIVDDQASAKLGTFKNQLNSVAGPSSTLGKNVATLNQSFTAGVKPITAQGNALTNLQTNLAANTKSTRLSINALKDHVLGMGVAVAGAISLATSFNDLRAAGIKNDKAQLMAAANQQKVVKIQEALNKMQREGKQGTTAYAIKLNDLKIAQERAGIASQRAELVQDQYNETLANFATQIIPQAISTAAGFTDVLQGMGVKTSSVTGIISKLGGSLGTLKGLAGGAVGTFGLIGVAIAAAVGSFLYLKETIEKTQDVLKNFKAAEGITNAVDKLKAMNDQLDRMRAHPAADSISGIADALGLLGGSSALKDITVDLAKADIKSKALANSVSDLGKGFLATSADYIKWSENMIKDGKSQADVMKFLTDSSINAWQALAILNVAVAKTSTTASPIPKLWNAIAASMLTGHQAANDYSYVLIGLNKNIFENTTISGQQSKALANIPDKYKTSATFAQLFGDKTKLAADAMTKFNATHQPAITGMTGVETAIQQGTTNFQTFIDTTKNGIITADRYKASLVDWATNELHIAGATKMSASELEQHIKAVMGDVDAIDALNKALTSAASQGFSDFVKAGQDVFKKGFDKLEIKKDFDAISKEGDKFQANFLKQMGGAGFEGAKAFALKFAETPKKFIKPKDMFAFDDLINWIKANAGLPAAEFAKQLNAKWKDLAPETKTKFGALLAGLPDVAGTIGETAGGTLATGVMKGFQVKLGAKDLGLDIIKKLNQQRPPGFDMSQLFNQGGGSTITTPQKIPPVDQTVYQKSLQLAIDNANQTVQFIKTAIMKLASVVMPVVSQVKFQAGLQVAIANAGQTVKFINTALQKVKGIVIPAADQSRQFQKGLFLAIANAKKTVQLIEKELKKVSGITVPAPDLHNFNSALNQMVSNAKRAARETANALKSARSSGGSQGRGPGATTGPFAEGGVVIANQRTTATFGEAGPEAAVFLPLNGRTGLSSGGRSDNGGSGDLNVTNIIRLDDREILRSFRRKMGTNRFTMGP